MRKIKTWCIGIIITFIIVHIVCLVATRITGGGEGLLVTITEFIASIIIYRTVKDDFNDERSDKDGHHKDNN